MRELGSHPETGLPVYLVQSPFGPYIQCGRATDENPTPQGCWLPEELNTPELSLETAISLLQFPKTLGTHPVTGAAVTIHLQNIGPTVRSEILQGDTVRHAVTRLYPVHNVLTLTLAQAVDLLSGVKER
jgi:DNA topoisomerase-1